MRLPRRLRQHWKWVAGFVAFVAVVALVFGEARIRPYVTGDPTVITSAITENIAGTVDLFDPTVPHELTIEVSEAEYDEMSAVNAKAAFFFLKEAGRNLNDNGKVCTLVTSLLGAFTPFYASYAGTKAPVEHFTRAAAREFGARGISVTAVGPGPMDTPFFYPAEGIDAVAYHRSASALSPFSKTGLTDIGDVVPFIRHLVSDGWWITGQTILINGGYTTK